VLEQFPAPSRIQYLRGIAACRRRDYRQAAERLHPHWKHRRWHGKSLSQVGKLDQAEALLLPLADWHPVCPADLAWNLRRPGDTDWAVEVLKGHHGHFPDNRHTPANLRRLKALELSTGEIQEEIAASEQRGEATYSSLLPAYLKALRTAGTAGRTVFRSRPQAAR